MKPAIEEILSSIETVEELYHRLVIVVGNTNAGKSDALRTVADQLGNELVNVNPSLSERLLDLTEKQRIFQLPTVLSDLVSGQAETALLDNLEILFDVSLKQDPLRLLQGLSRNRTIIASGAGRVDDGTLIYAEPGHPEYRSYPAKDLQLVVLQPDDKSNQER